MDHKYHDLKDDFQSATHHDPMQCLPLVFCAIHADPDDLLSTLEAAFRKAFRYNNLGDHCMEGRPFHVLRGQVSPSQGIFTIITSVNLHYSSPMIKFS